MKIKVEIFDKGYKKKLVTTVLKMNKEDMRIYFEEPLDVFVTHVRENIVSPLADIFRESFDMDEVGTKVFLLSK